MRVYMSWVVVAASLAATVGQQRRPSSTEGAAKTCYGVPDPPGYVRCSFSARVLTFPSQSACE
jgi:hypothetical protein